MSTALVATGCAPDAHQIARLLAPALLEQVRDAIIVLGIDHGICLWNKNAEHLYGWREDEVLGRPIHTLGPAGGTVCAEACNAVHTHGEWRGEITLSRKDGSIVAAQACWRRLADEQGRPFAIVATHNQVAGGMPTPCAEPGMPQASGARGAAGRPAPGLAQRRMER